MFFPIYHPFPSFFAFYDSSINFVQCLGSLFASPFLLFSKVVTSRLCPLLHIPPKLYNLLYDAIPGNRNFASNRKHGSIIGTTPFKKTHRLPHLLQTVHPHPLFTFSTFYTNAVPFSGSQENTTWISQT